MKILVAVKRVIDFKTSVRIKSDGSGIETTNVKMSMNPFDEIAIEEAVRLKEKNLASEITAVSIGNVQCQETLRTALAMGADKALLIQTESEIQPLAAAKLLQKIAEQEKPDLIILGKQAIDTDNNQVGQMLAALLNWPQGTFASAIAIQEKNVSVTREIDGGLETLSLTMPAVITTDLRLNEPRYISLPNIMQAKRKPLTTIDAATLSTDIAPRVKTLKYSAPKKERRAVKVNSVSELIDRLKNEAKVI